MIKFLCISVLFALFGYVGLAFGQTYMQKYEFFNDALSFIRFLKGEISFLKTDLQTLCNSYSCKSKFNSVVKNFVNILQQNSECKYEDFEYMLCNFNFQNSEKRVLSELFYDLGKLNLNEQIAKLNYIEQQLITIVEENEKQKKKMVPVCNKMGFLIGAVLCIVLI